jgi:hypothetical protein
VIRSPLIGQASMQVSQFVYRFGSANLFAALFA